MDTASIRPIFAHRIDRPIEEVIKVDQTSEEVLRDEIAEYVVTGSIEAHYTDIFESYRTTRQTPREGIAVWISGFFGSGKSSFAKMLGLSIENRDVCGEPAARRFAQRAGSAKIDSLLRMINEHVPTHAVIFDVSTDRGIRSGNQTLTEIMYGLFLQSLGYAKDLDLSELEITLEEKGELGRFEETYRELFPGKDWSREKTKVAFALSEASRVLHHLDPATYPMADSWVKAVKNKADISPGKLADRANELMDRRRPGKTLLFVVDEVGQFVARDVQKMLDLQGIVQSLGVRGRGRHWLVVTSQEKLGELVSGLDETKIELARLMDRFPLQVHLEPSDISEVTSRRVLAKNADAEKVLAALWEGDRSRLLEATRLTADIRLPVLDRSSFIDLYPLLPYQIDLIIQIVSGLRTQGGASKHVGGANRTIIKLAQQLLVHRAIGLADAPLGTLARLDHVYDLVENNIGSEVRAKIASVARDVDHPLAAPVAKVICLLQYARSVHRTAENIAACLHENVSADSRLAEVQAALVALERAHKVRRGDDDGWRIPTPAEDDWDQVRQAIAARPGDLHRLHAEVLASFWQPQPSFTFHDTKTFRAGLAIHGREVVAGDLVFQLHLADDAAALPGLAAELQDRSREERKHVFWALALSDAILYQAEELHRSRDMLARKERQAKTADETALIGEEKLRQRRHQEELRRLLRAACLAGNVYVRGNDRSPPEGATDVGKAAAEILAKAVPQVYERFAEAAVKPADAKRAMDALFTAENLQGLPAVFQAEGLGLLRVDQGKTVFRVEEGPLLEVARRIRDRATYGDTATGRYLADELGKEPFGWDFDAVRLLTLALLRAGVIEATSKGVTIDSATSQAARGAFENNPFRQASFRPRLDGCDYPTILTGAEHVTEVFGLDVKEIEETVVAGVIRTSVAKAEASVRDVVLLLERAGLPGGAALLATANVMRQIVALRDCPAIQGFSADHRAIHDAIRRAAELEQALPEPRLHDLARARRVLDVAWPILAGEADLSLEVRSHAEELRDLLARETFFRELPAIEQHARALEQEYARRFDDAVQARIDASTRALARLTKTPGWSDLPEDVQRTIAAPFEAGQVRPPATTSIALLRSERDACDGRLRAAIRAVHEALEGERLATVQVHAYFAGGVETEEQLDAALDGLREECARLIGAGKKVVLS